jgi:hypothetical protein
VGVHHSTILHKDLEWELFMQLVVGIKLVNRGYMLEVHQEYIL